MATILPRIVVIVLLQIMLYCRVINSFVPVAATRSTGGTRLFSQGDTFSVGIVGGGLAGLATAYHLLEKNPLIQITILDKAQPGSGGASAVAGG